MCAKTNLNVICVAVEVKPMVLDYLSNWQHINGEEERAQNVSGYVCNHGSPSGERDTASPRGRYGGTPSA